MDQAVLLKEKCAITFLKSWLELNQEKNPRFGTRAACKMLGIGHGTLSNILARRRKLSMGLAVRMSEKMNLDPKVKNHFLLLNTLNEMDSDRLQVEVQKRILQNAQATRANRFGMRKSALEVSVEWKNLLISLGYGDRSEVEKIELIRHLEVEIEAFFQDGSDLTRAPSDASVSM